MLAPACSAQSNAKVLCGYHCIMISNQRNQPSVKLKQTLAKSIGGKRFFKFFICNLFLKGGFVRARFVKGYIANKVLLLCGLLFIVANLVGCASNVKPDVAPVVIEKSEPVPVPAELYAVGEYPGRLTVCAAGYSLCPGGNRFGAGFNTS